MCLVPRAVSRHRHALGLLPVVVRSLGCADQPPNRRRRAMGMLVDVPVDSHGWGRQGLWHEAEDAVGPQAGPIMELKRLRSISNEGAACRHQPCLSSTFAPVCPCEDARLPPACTTALCGAIPSADSRSPRRSRHDGNPESSGRYDVTIGASQLRFISGPRCKARTDISCADRTLRRVGRERKFISNPPDLRESDRGGNRNPCKSSTL